MIANEYQYNLTKAQASTFEQILTQLESSHETDANAVQPILRKAERNALRSQLESLRMEMADYEELRSGHRRSFRAETLEDLPRILIEARIARGLTQKQLAERLGLKEQQIQRYEATCYASASLKRINEIVRALNLDVSEAASLK